MVNTRSISNKKQEETMGTITNKMKRYFEKLIKPLATNKSLEYLFNKLKNYLFKKFDEKISEQNAKIEKLESIISIFPYFLLIGKNLLNTYQLMRKLVFLTTLC